MRPSRPPSLPPEPPPDSRFGELTLVERIAVGGMAEVFRAREPRAVGEARTVVVKRMLPHIAAEPDAGRMFAAEAELGGLVLHPNVVRVLGHGRADGRPYLTLELVPGVDLWRLLRFLDAEGGKPDVELAVLIGRELLAGLHAVHEAAGEDGAPLGIVHGDVSPSNVLLSVHGEVKLADFGIAEARLRSSFPQAAAGRTRGKLGYLSPEQVRGDETDRRADVFAAAAVVAELLMGRPLFVRESDLATLLAIRNADIEALATIARELPGGLFDALAQALAPDPVDRFPTAQALAKALGACVETDARSRAALGALVARAAASAHHEPSPVTREEITVEPLLRHHLVRSADGRALGPWTFPMLMEAVSSGRLASDDLVCVDGVWQRIADLHQVAEEISGEHEVDPERITQLPTAPPPPGGVGVDLARGGIVEALCRSAVERSTGVWVCTCGDLRTEIVVVEGVPQQIGSEAPGERLVASGALTRGELEMALAVLPRFAGSLHDTLIALGLMEASALRQHLAGELRESLLALFTWTGGQARFQAEAPDQPIPPVDLDVWELVTAGVERRLARGLEQDTFARHMMDDLLPGRSPPAGAPAEVKRLAALVSYPRPLQEVVELLEDPKHRDVHRPYRIVRLGLALELVVWSSP